MKSEILLVTVVGILASSQAATVPNCYGIINGYMIGNPLVLNEFYLCDNNIPIPMLCPSNMLFCSVGNIQGCLPSCSVLTLTACSNEVTTAAIPTAPNGNIPTAPTVANRQQSPTMNIPTAPTATPVSDGQCSGLSDGTISPIWGSCSGYVMCANGKAVVGACAENTVFNGATGTCGTVACTW